MDVAIEHPISNQDLAWVEEMGRKRAEITLEVKKVIVGQEKQIEQTVMAILGRGHALLMGVPGPRRCWCGPSRRR